MTHPARTYDPSIGSRPCLPPAAYIQIAKSRRRRKIALEWAKFGAAALAIAAAMWAYFATVLSL